MRTVSNKQFLLFLFFITVITKLLYLPSVLSYFAMKNAYLITIILLLADLLIVFLLLGFFEGKKAHFLKKIKKEVSPAFSKALILFYAICFLFKTLLLILEASEFFQASFNVNFINYEFFVLLGVLILFSFNLSFRTILRGLEFIFPILILGGIFVLIVSVSSVDLLNLLPLNNVNVNAVLKGTINSVFWFGSGTVLLFFTDKVKVNASFKKNTLLIFLLANLLVVAFVVCFYGSFASFSLEEKLSLYALLNNMNANSAFSKFDWLFLSVWSIAFLMAIILFTYITFYLFNKVFKIKNNKILAVCMLIVMFIFLLLVNFDANLFLPILNVFKVFFIAVQYIIPIALSSLFLTKRSKNE